MQSDLNFTTEELKAAGDEVEQASLLEFGENEENASLFQNSEQEIVHSATGIDEGVAADEPKGNEETDLLNKIDKYQQRIVNEQTALEKIYQEVKELKQKLESKIELLKKLQTKSKDFHDELTLVQQEEEVDSLRQMKDKIKKNYE